MTISTTMALQGSGSEVRLVSDSPPDSYRDRFETLFMSHHDPVLRYLLRRCDNREDAADLVAETFLIAWRRLDDLPADQPLPWLYGVARRVVANHRRGEIRRHGLADKLRGHLISSPQYDAADLELTSSELGWAARAFRRLSDSDRELLSLAAWEGLDTAQLAAALGCSKNAAVVRLHRARRRLEKLMKNRPTDHPALPGQARGEQS
jgi:RNA polymerase sigma-70 factor (ECF subfamily)